MKGKIPEDGVVALIMTSEPQLSRFSDPLMAVAAGAPNLLALQQFHDSPLSFFSKVLGRAQNRKCLFSSLLCLVLALYEYSLASISSSVKSSQVTLASPACDAGRDIPPLSSQFILC